MWTDKSILAALGGLVLIVTLAAGWYVTQPPVREPEEISIDLQQPRIFYRIRLIQASKKNPGFMDPALSDIQSELSNLPYNHFALLDDLQEEVPLKNRADFRSGDNAISIRWIEETREKLKLEISLHDKFNMQVVMPNSGKILIVGPSHHNDNIVFEVGARMRDRGSDTSI